LGALEQRLKKYQDSENEAKEQENSGKARRMGRIAKVATCTLITQCKGWLRDEVSFIILDLYSNISYVMIAQWDSLLSVLPVARVQFPAMAEYFKGFFPG